MQGQRGIFDTFPETVDLNQGTDFNSRGINESGECNIRLSPTERRLLSNDLSGELNFGSVNASDHHNSRSFSSWDVGESSSRANLQNQTANDDLKPERNWSQFDSSNSQLSSGSNHGRGGGFETEASSSSAGIRMSSDCDMTDSSFGNWGISCKRKASEGTSGEFFGSGSSSCFPEAEDIVWQTLPNCNNGSSSVAASSSMVNSQEQINSIAAAPESSQSYYGMRNPSPVNISSAGNTGRRFSHNEPPDPTSRGPISSHPSNVPPLMHPFTWNGNGNSRPGSSSSSSFGTVRNNEQNRYFVPSNETRNRASSNSGSNAVWTPHLDSRTQYQQRASEFRPWTLFPSTETEPVGHRARFSPFPSSSSSTSEENVGSSGVNSHGSHHQPLLRSESMEVAGDEWQAFAVDIEGRHRLVSEMRQILNALRRAENLRGEDYLLFDPFTNGVAELHDSHRDMRLDVDDMSYEELLALEERIGDVKTGLSEKAILESMKQRKHISFMAISTPNLEPCCICREEYDDGDDIGTLDCGHDFHTDCIKEWLTQKNLCPICRMTGLSSSP